MNPEPTHEPGDPQEPKTEPAVSTQPAASTPSGQTSENWETRYKGLQRVVDSKDKEISNLSAQLENLSASLEEMKAQSGLSTKKSTELEQSLAETKSQLESITAERDKFQQDLTRSNIIAKEFSELIGLEEYIPVSDDPEVYRANAKAFAEKLNSRASQAAEALIEGSSPRLPVGKTEKVTASQVDAAYTKAVKLAGIPGKEAEYDAALAEYQRLFELRQS